MTRLMLGALFCTVAAGCADDGPGSLEVDLQPDRATLPADGSSSANLLVTLFYEDGTAGALGTTVTILCFGSGQEPFGHLGGSSTVGVSTVQVDELGLADVSFRCSGEDDEEQTVVCLARTGNVSGSSPPIRCLP